MSLAPTHTTPRGQVVLQPTYFTCSLFVDPAREDIDHLIHVYAERYARSPPSQPFLLFKDTWNNEGWTWLHFKVFDARSRDAFLKVAMQLLSERLAASEYPLTRAAALFGLYTFFATQPSTSAPPLYALAHLPMTIDMYESLLKLPDVLETDFLRPLRPHIIYVLSALQKAQFFHILPPSNLYPHSPRELPREKFISDGYEQAAYFSTNASKKKGRPSKHDKVKKSKDAVVALDKWLDKTAYTYQPPRVTSAEAPQSVTTHILLSHPPSTTRNNYRAKKSELLEKLEPDYPYVTTEGPGRAALERANLGVVSRLQKIDEEAAAKGMEIGGEGGERTGLRRVERAADELGKIGSLGGRGGLLGLLEGAGIVE
ncbi:uncharacterized protein F5891DRAFT_7073 [Suillus fuscotomentosus]|uniref:Uncharacterized protein n=1 Tax=Suillus fuscotomentosus TaxID=1912939 RepID=A0AAD4EL80_9AGAM|nr:uncharacterized protein F5891DRAFT_7073 [Suillus fuscotomentosus]KAG1908260.1 hypothetical protein F5891DRAFT_7073 [Suillus fuscotomentosus]